MPQDGGPSQGLFLILWHLKEGGDLTCAILNKIITDFHTEIRRGITLTVGREEVINFTLRVGQLTAVVEVTAEAPLVETTTAAMSSLVDERTIRDLPLNGRSYDQLALTQPGVVSVG